LRGCNFAKQKMKKVKAEAEEKEKDVELCTKENGRFKMLYL